MPGGLDYTFLTAIRWIRILLEFVADGFVELPAFSGSTIRGALGRALRPELCAQSPECEQDCADPAGCRYYSLFEQRESKGRGIPKPMILTPPMPAELEEVAHGRAVRFPYVETAALPGESVPRIGSHLSWRVESGAAVGIGLTLVGQAAAMAPALIECLGVGGLRPAGGRLRLRRATDGSGRVLFDARLPEAVVHAPLTESFGELVRRGETARRLRVVFLTPAVVHVEGGTCMDPAEIAQRFARLCLVRAMQIHDAFFRADGGRLPWMELPEMGVRLAGSRLFRYVLPRVSFRQDRRMHFDGVVGYLDLEGDLTPAMPFIRAAEVLHFGQKATFGLGRIQCFVQATQS